MFQLPAYNLLCDWLLGILILTTVLSAAVHVLDGAIQPWARFKGFAPHVKAHLSVLAALIVLTWGFRYWISIYQLNYSTIGQIIGAGYTDIHAQIPAYTILIFISIATAVALLANIRFQGWRLPAIALGVWLGASILLGAVWPALVQQFVVAPNEASAEAPYITRNIAMTRQAFDLTERAGQEVPGRRGPHRRKTSSPTARRWPTCGCGTPRSSSRATASCSPCARTTSSPMSTLTATASTARGPRFWSRRAR